MIEMFVSPTIQPSIQMASIGIPDTMFLMVLALIVFGPRRLPEIGRQIGKLMYEFRKVSNEFKFQMEEELRASEEAERQAKLKAAAAVTQELPAPVQFTAGTDTVAVGEANVEAAGEAKVAESSVTDSPEAEAPGEVRAEARKFPPTIQPPSTGEIVQAARPYRSWNEPTGAKESELQPGHEVAALHAADANGTVPVSREEHTQTDVQPGADPAVNQGTEREANHA